MIELVGKYNTAKVYNDCVEASAQAQIIQLCNQEFTKNTKIRVMSDVHSGTGCVIGMTIDLAGTDKIVPNIVGVDINCGILVVALVDKNINLELLDNFIHKSIPSGTSIREEAHSFNNLIDYEDLRCRKHIDINRAMLSVGTLGGGNHFIEVDKDSEGRLYLLIHSGSRYLGKQVCEYYQNLAYNNLHYSKEMIQDTIKSLKAAGKAHLIQEELQKLKNAVPSVPKELAYLEGQDTKDYLNDMLVLEKYAMLNREAIGAEIIRYMKLEIHHAFTTIHNYVDVQNNILRKGAVSAQAGEELVIPINMRDGSLLCVGKGNEDWNYSAPHGAGRHMSRGKAKETLSLEKFEQDMKDAGIYTTSVSRSTLDESGDAYKPIEEILAHIGDTVHIKERIVPIYNYKSGEDIKYSKGKKVEDNTGLFLREAHERLFPMARVSDE